MILYLCEYATDCPLNEVDKELHSDVVVQSLAAHEPRGIADFNDLESAPVIILSGSLCDRSVRQS